MSNAENPVSGNAAAIRLNGQPDAKNYRRIARYAGPVGLKGEIKIVAPEEAAPWLTKQRTLLLTSAAKGESSHYWQLNITSWHHTHGDNYRACLEKVSTRTALETLYLPKGALWAENSVIPKLSKDEFWLDDLVGLAVADENGTLLGEITAWLEGNGQIFVEILPKGKQTTAMLPFEPVFFPTLDWESRKITVSTQIAGFIIENE